MGSLLRRQFLWSAPSCLSLLVLGCSPSGDESNKKASAKGPDASRLVVGLSSLGAAESWLPWAEGREGSLVFNAIYESLVRIDEVTGDIVPAIAERWSVDPTGTRWSFFIRKGVKFHENRGEVTSRDVKFSYEQLVSDKAINSNKPYFRAIVKGVETPSDHEVVFVLASPSVTFIGRMIQNFGVVSQAYMTEVGDQEAARKPVGTGPYRMVEHKRQEFVRLEAIPNHWRESAKFGSLVLKRIPDQSSRLAMLRSGEIDVTEIPFKFKREAEAAQLKLLRVEASAIYHVQLGGQFLPTQATFDPQVPWVGQPGDAASEARARMVRRALSMAVDRKAIIQAVFEGEAIECAIPFFVPQSRFIPKDIMPPAYDPAGAKKLLAEAGYANGFSRDIEMILMPWPGRAEMVDVSEAVAGFWEKNLGLRVKRVPMEYAAFVPNVAYPRKLPWVCWSHGFIPAPVAEPVMAMDSWLTSRTRFGSVAERPDIDALSDAIHSAPTPEARLVKYHELAKLFYDEALAVPIAAAPTLYAYNPKKLRGWSLPAGDSYLNGYERALPEV